MNTDNTSPPSGLAPVPGSLRLWAVSGICMVPTRCTRIVEAATEAEAIALAVASDWQKHIDQMSGDEGAAYDWQPFAEAIDKSPLPAWQQPVRANASDQAARVETQTEEDQ
jgi:hypothetical protein